MKLLFTSLVLVTILSCKGEPKTHQTEAKEALVAVKVAAKEYPETLQKIFDAHGGLQQWQKMRVLSFEIPKADAVEKHTTDLKTRNEKIELSDVAMGYDGTDFWLSDEKMSYKGDPVFYHNLMFYFYSIPFVLADSGIHYSEGKNVNFEGVSYPGIKISYDSGIGTSSNDEYFLQYNPKTFQIEWLGYTVTYKTNEKSEKINWIRYNDWMQVNELLLPKSIAWYTHDDLVMLKADHTVNFENVQLHETALAKGFFAKPKAAKIVTPKN